MTADLITFLLNQFDDDERDSERAHYSLCSAVALRGPGHPCDCGFPEQRRAEVNAKRLILDLHKADETWPNNKLVCTACAGPSGLADYPCATVALLALPYADRYGYREEWRP